MGKVYDNGIKVITGFKPSGKNPIVDNQDVDTFNDLLTLAPVFEYMRVTVHDEDGAQYMWNGLDQSDSNNWIKQGSQATEVLLGLVKIATQEQVNIGTDDLTTVTPLKLTTKLGEYVTLEGTQIILGSKIFDKSLASSATSPMVSAPDGIVALNGTVLTADGSGGSAWMESAGGDIPTLQAVTEAGATSDKSITLYDELKILSHNVNSMSIRCDVDDNLVTGLIFTSKRPNTTTDYIGASLEYGASNRSASQETSTLSINVLGEGVNNEFMFTSSGTLRIPNTFSTPALSPLGSRPNNINAIAGSVLSADGAGGSQWKELFQTILVSTYTELDNAVTQLEIVGGGKIIFNNAINIPGATIFEHDFTAIEINLGGFRFEMGYNSYIKHTSSNLRPTSFFTNGIIKGNKTSLDKLFFHCDTTGSTKITFSNISFDDIVHNGYTDGSTPGHIKIETGGHFSRLELIQTILYTTGEDISTLPLLIQTGNVDGLHLLALQNKFTGELNRSNFISVFGTQPTSDIDTDFTYDGSWNKIPYSVNDYTIREQNIYPYQDINSQWYGVEWDSESGSTECTRIGNLDMHVSLPIHNERKRCLVWDNGTVHYYLDPNDSTKKEDGTAAVLDGTDGQLMVENPKDVYISHTVSGTVHKFKISKEPLDGFTKMPNYFIGACEASLERSTGKLCSIYNTGVDYRGGNNTSAWDAQVNSLLGMPVTYLTRAEFRAAAALRGSNWHINLKSAHSLTAFLYIIEYANLNSQLAFNGSLTTGGYRQGGLGEDNTNADSTEWSNFNSYNPVLNNSLTFSLGNNTGVVSDTITDFGGTGIDRTFSAHSYRGEANIFGHIWKFVDGFNINEHIAYITDDINYLADDTTNGYSLKGTMPSSNGLQYDFLQNNLLIPSKIAGTTSISDYYYQSAGWRVSMVGGSLSAGSDAGLFALAVHRSSSSRSSSIGARLCLLIE